MELTPYAVTLEAILKDKIFIKNKCSDAKVHIMKFSLRIRNIDATIHEIKKYVQMSFIFSIKRTTN